MEIMEMMPLTATAESRGPYITFVATCARIEGRKRKTREATMHSRLVGAEAKAKIEASCKFPLAKMTLRGGGGGGGGGGRARRRANTAALPSFPPSSLPSRSEISLKEKRAN